jgi:hypothetical protein
MAAKYKTRGTCVVKPYSAKPFFTPEDDHLTASVV